MTVYNNKERLTIIIENLRHYVKTVLSQFKMHSLQANPKNYNL